MIDRMIQLSMAGALLLSPGLSMAAGIVQLPVTGQTVCFSGNGAVITCTGTGQDGDKQAGAPLPAARFTDNGTGTVSDNLTGLMWSKHANAPNRALPAHPVIQCTNAEADMSWQQSLDFVKCLNTNTFAGFSDWRLPNLNELESLVNAGVPDSAAFLNANSFGFGTAFPQSQVQSSDYWSSTSESQFPDSAWDVNLVAGDFPLTSVKIPLNVAIDTRGVWPVRGTSTAPAQLWRTGQATCSNDAGVAIDCAGTGQDGEKLAGAAAPVPRFQANAGATFAVDKLTGLIWTTNTLTPGPAACPNSGRPQGLTWQEALDHVKCLNTNAFLGRSDWRLPNRKELRSLADYGKSGPALSAGNPFPNEVGNTFWSSTTNTAQTKRAWTISMFDGSLSDADKRNSLLPAWPVSGPDAAAAPALTMNAVTAMTNVATQTVTGTVEAGVIPVVTVSTAATVGPVTVNGTNWSCVLSNLAEGANTINVAANAAGITTAMPPTTITVDTVPPALIMDAVATRSKGTSKTISGTVEAGVTPVVTAGTGATVGPVTVNGGKWSCQISGLKPGANDVTVTAADAAGNAAAKSAALTVLIADGVLKGGGEVNISDALKALRMAASLVPATDDDLLHGDVAPPDAQDGKIDVADALLILKKAAGLPSF